MIENMTIDLPPELRQPDGQTKVVWMDIPVPYQRLRSQLEQIAKDMGFEGGRDIDTLFIQRSPERGNPCRISMAVKHG